MEAVRWMVANPRLRQKHGKRVIAAPHKLAECNVDTSFELVVSHFTGDPATNALHDERSIVGSGEPLVISSRGSPPLVTWSRR